MSDLIDRRAAIDALEKIDCSDGVGISLLKCDAVDDAVTAIKALPSAQPEIIRCRDCEYWHDITPANLNGYQYCHAFRDMMPKDGYCHKAQRREVSK